MAGGHQIQWLIWASSDLWCMKQFLLFPVAWQGPLKKNKRSSPVIKPLLPQMGQFKSCSSGIRILISWLLMTYQIIDFFPPKDPKYLLETLQTSKLLLWGHFRRVWDGAEGEETSDGVNSWHRRGREFFCSAPDSGLNTDFDKCRSGIQFSTWRCQMGNSSTWGFWTWYSTCGGFIG